MFSTGICLILNYDVFDETVLPPEMRTEDGKRTVGIILTVCGLLAIFVSVLVSALYLCNKQKPGQVNPNDLSHIPSTARNDTPEGRGSIRRSLDNRSSGSISNGPLPPPRNVGVLKPNVRPPPIMGSTEVKHPRYKKRHRHKQKFPRQSRLEEIKEADAISRKTLEGAVLQDTYSPRSDSISSEQTLEDSRHPRIVLNRDLASDNNRPPSVESGSTSMTSDTSNYRTLESDKTRRELQFIPDANVGDGPNTLETASKDSLDDCSLVVAYKNTLENDVENQGATVSVTSEDQYSAGGGSELSQQRGSSTSNSQVLPDYNQESDGSASLSSYKPHIKNEILRTKADGQVILENGGVVNKTFEAEDDIHIPGQSDVNSEEGEEIAHTQVWRSDETESKDHYL